MPRFLLRIVALPSNRCWDITPICQAADGKPLAASRWLLYCRNNICFSYEDELRHGCCRSHAYAQRRLRQRDNTYFVVGQHRHDFKTMPLFTAFYNKLMTFIYFSIIASLRFTYNRSTLQFPAFDADRRDLYLIDASSRRYSYAK